MNAALTLDGAPTPRIFLVPCTSVSATPLGELHGRLHRMLTILRELAASLSASVASTLHRAEPKP